MDWLLKGLARGPDRTEGVYGRLTRSELIHLSLRRFSSNLCRLRCRIEFGVDSVDGLGPGDGVGEARYA